MQESKHPHPGQPHHLIGFPRISFLPDNDKIPPKETRGLNLCQHLFHTECIDALYEHSEKVLSLLIEAWKRRLIFTVGQSSTTGMDDCVIWTGIHHKTEIQSRRGHGYPDATYLDRVTAELEAEGVIPDE